MDIFKLYDKIVDELASWDGPAIANEICQYYKDKNPYHVDLAFKTCKEKGITPSATMVQIMEEVAEKRFNGALSGTSASITKNLRKQSIFMFMMNCIYEKRKIEEASELAILYQEIRFPKDKAYTVETLVKFYKKKIVDTGIQGYSFKSWDRFKLLDEQFVAGRKQYVEFINTLEKVIKNY